MTQILQLTGQLSFKPVITEEKEITANGTYTPTAGKDGFSKVTVNVQPELEEKTVTANGTYIPTTGKDGFSKVVVNVPSEEPILTELAINESNADYNITPVAPAVGFSKVDVLTSGVFQIDKSEIDELAPGASLQYMGLYTGIVITNNS